uniref:Reverse transcriptase zinc-binding domain-containing protein n=1 Tax=Manihot esculenta TaxID=3983 RepID=A0A2C9VMD5_MANES
MYKVNYFPNCTFLEAKTNPRANYTWQSLMKAKWVIEKGAGWLIGNGETIRIWKDSWLPQQNGFWVWSIAGNFDNNAIVCELFHENRLEWNMDLIRSTFLPFEVEQVLQLPLSGKHEHDVIMWTWSKQGRFTVRLAYHFIFSSNQVDTASMSSPQQSFNPKVWKLNIPPKGTSGSTSNVIMGELEGT